MKRSLLSLVAGTLFLAACGPADVVVSVQLESADGEARPIEDLEVQLIPFDRDAVFDSLEAAFGTPQPAIPDEVLAAQQAIAEAQTEWQTQLNREANLREQLQGISDELETLNPGMARYRQLFGEFNNVERQLNAATRAAEAAFEEFTGLQESNIAAVDSIRIVREAWANDAFAEVEIAFLERMEATGLDMATDTTEATGVARFAVSPGTYWVHARLERSNDELYWNEVIEVVKGEENVITLNVANGESRPLI
jgi:prophage DNA circulation protein